MMCIVRTTSAVAAASTTTTATTDTKFSPSQMRKRSSDFRRLANEFGRRNFEWKIRLAQINSKRNLRALKRECFWNGDESSSNQIALRRNRVKNYFRKFRFTHKLKTCEISHTYDWCTWTLSIYFHVKFDAGAAVATALPPLMLH